MDRTWDAESIGEQLGMESVGSVVEKVEAYCTYEGQRIALTNQPRILALRTEGSFLMEEERALTERLRNASPPGDLRSRRRRVAYYWGITIVLTLAAFVFSLLTFDPFRTGWKGYLYCLGIAVATPFLLEQVLEKWKAERIFKTLAAIACVAALTSLVLLAVIRGDLFAQELKNTAPVITLDDAQPQPQPENTFYGETVALLRLVMAFLAIAMELGAGLALHEAWRMGSDSEEDCEKLRERYGAVRERMVAITFEITALQNEASVFAARFWRNFYRAMLTHSVRSAMTKLLVAVLAICITASGHAAAQNHTTVVIAVDLTQSVAVIGPDGKSDFQKNIDAVTKLLAELTTDSRVTIIGITDHSFTQPDILISATIPADPGYFRERLNIARRELLRVWKMRSTKLRPSYRYTDIIGALMLAGQLFDQQRNAGQKILVIYSDMRHRTPDLDLESPALVPPFAKTTLKGGMVVVTLRHVHVWVLGVDGAGKSAEYWQSLEQYWKDYFHTTVVNLESYSVLRDTMNVLADLM